MISFGFTTGASLAVSRLLPCSGNGVHAGQDDLHPAVARAPGRGGVGVDGMLVGVAGEREPTLVESLSEQLAHHARRACARQLPVARVDAAADRLRVGVP